MAVKVKTLESKGLHEGNSMFNRVKLSIAAIVPTLALVIPVDVNAGALNSRRIFLNKSFICNNTLQSVQWQNTTGQTLYIRHVTYGYSYSFDTTDALNYSEFAEIKRVSDGTILSYGQRQANGQTKYGYYENFDVNAEQNYVTLANNDKIQLTVKCLYTRPFTRVVNVTIFYTVGSP
jgi:hypothetical protein